MTSRFFEIQKRKGWAEIIFRNGSYNYITPDVLAEMEAAVSVIERDGDAHGAVLRSGVKGIFSKGIDVAFTKPGNGEQLSAMITKARNALSRIAGSPVPFVCAVDGECFGAGLELMLSCDIRIATSASRFGAPEVIFGLLPTDEGIRRLLSMIGKGQASRMLLTGMTIDAEEARRVGLIEETVQDDELENRCKALAARLGRIRRPGITAMKSAVQRNAGLLADAQSKNTEQKKEMAAKR